MIWIFHNVGGENKRNDLTRFPGNTGRDKDNICTCNSGFKLTRSHVTCHFWSGFDMAEICSHTRCVGYIKQWQMADKGSVLQKQGQWLTNSTSSSKNTYFGIFLKNLMKITTKIFCKFLFKSFIEPIQMNHKPLINPKYMQFNTLVKNCWQRSLLYLFSMKLWLYYS